MNHLLDLLEVACRGGDGRGDGRGHEKLLGLLAGKLLAKHLQLTSSSTEADSRQARKKHQHEEDAIAFTSSAQSQLSSTANACTRMQRRQESHKSSSMKPLKPTKY